MPVQFSLIRQDQYPATDGQRSVQIFIPDDDAFLPLLAALLSIPSNTANYQDPDSEQAQGIASAWEAAYVFNLWEDCP